MGVILCDSVVRRVICGGVGWVVGWLEDVISLSVCVSVCVCVCAAAAACETVAWHVFALHGLLVRKIKKR